ncbi:acyl-CoA synthetase [Nocardia africana]|uniref:4-chlorobenzoate--CoA ligase n=1 Tax=Nocardia africana TaxID=134964 RepID=A0A378X064_9NOCA|nr:4-chlorobenzoate--CoA ligase [Nocardia africana]
MVTGSIETVPHHIRAVTEKVAAVAVLHRAGVVDLTRPDRLRRVAAHNRTYGPQAALIMKAAAEQPDSVALIDERGALTYRELDERSNALASALTAMGLEPGAVIAVLARDHRGLVLAISAAGRAGLRLAMMNTGFAKPQFAEVARREKVRAVLHDGEFTDLLDALPPDLPRVLTWSDDGHGVPGDAETIDRLIARGNRSRPAPPPRPGGFVILTSGTTGLPKGAPRTRVSPLLSATFVDRIPFPRNGTAVIASPLFHSTGFGMWTVNTAIGNTTVLLRRFDAEATLRAVADHRAQMLVLVPTMLNRILALGSGVISRYDLRSLRTIVVAGSALAPDLATRAMDTFGDVLYNLYGSTEVAIATVARPAELRRAPGTVGRAPVTTDVVVLDADGRRIHTPGITGRVFVRSGAPFEGYTDGRTKEIVDGYITTGDLGHLDEHGLLHIDGRQDDMVVSGGENVHPLEVEHLLADLPEVADVAVIGVDDADFGQRLRAVIVRAPGAALDAEAVKAHVKANLARYKVPRDVVFVDELPRNATGKVLRRALEELDFA